MHLSTIALYPIKSCRGIQVARARLDDFGIHLDRRWMVVKPDGGLLTQREAPRMALIRVELVGDGVIVRAPGMIEQVVSAREDGAPATVRVWKDTVEACDQGDAVAEWFSRFLGGRMRVVYMPEDTLRRVDPGRVPEERRVSFADAFPFLILGEASLDELNRRLSAAVSMTRFRPNLVISGTVPFAEDGWREIRIGTVPFRVVKPCSRCVLTTVDPETGVKGKEPLATLATFRKRDGEVHFGQNALHLAEGILEVGDPVTG
ncbi:MAG: MOSC domain-containing protein [Gemmatimonadales bacterium]